MQNQHGEPTCKANMHACKNVLHDGCMLHAMISAPVGALLPIVHEVHEFNELDKFELVDQSAKNVIRNALGLKTAAAVL